MRLCVLASGSKGNCTYVESSEGALLLDAGLNRTEIVHRLAVAQLDPARIRGVLFTHEHDDHCSAIPVLHRYLDAELFANGGTAEAIDCAHPDAALPWTIFETGRPFDLAGFHIETFSVSHDTAEPVGYVLCADGVRLFYATDLGCITPAVAAAMTGCTAAVLESNHDPVLLMESKRTRHLKNRILGDTGHLSNEQAAAFMEQNAPDTLRLLLLAHVSQECNVPSLAKSVMRDALHRAGRDDIRVEVLSQESPSEVFTLATN
ncbi:MAG: MBL fold metallo-hydrolase [Kiritimatiellae bacterium]|nr:MBL fold metallo-hydrolase [Kiritimatiellia bacterium]